MIYDVKLRCSKVKFLMYDSYQFFTVKHDKHSLLKEFYIQYVYLRDSNKIAQRTRLFY